MASVASTYCSNMHYGPLASAATVTPRQGPCRALQPFHAPPFLAARYIMQQPAGTSFPSRQAATRLTEACLPGFSISAARLVGVAGRGAPCILAKLCHPSSSRQNSRSLIGIMMILSSFINVAATALPSESAAAPWKARRDTARRRSCCT